ncbi:MAG TPA: hypothetical protein VFH47_02770 [Candidatus Thermoplasmatota archaeon]|nr:hypothetical protein [Candidatus Thermoplasmatota archaeon]
MPIRPDDWEPKLEDPEVQQYIIEEVGEEGIEMATYLREAQPAKGEDILEHFKERKASEVRKVLYRMMEAHCAEYEKDTDSKGWETFIWRLDLMEIKYILRRRWADELENLQKQLKFEQDHQFYSCPDMHRRILFEDAFDLQFNCPVCHQMMSPVQTNEVQRALKRRIDELEPFFSQAAV